MCAQRCPGGWGQGLIDRETSLFNACNYVVKILRLGHACLFRFICGIESSRVMDTNQVREESTTYR